MKNKYFIFDEIKIEKPKSLLISIDGVNCWFPRSRVSIKNNEIWMTEKLFLEKKEDIEYQKKIKEVGGISNMPVHIGNKTSPDWQNEKSIAYDLMLYASDYPKALKLRLFISKSQIADGSVKRWVLDSSFKNSINNLGQRNPKLYNILTNSGFSGFEIECSNEILTFYFIQNASALALSMRS